MKAFEPGQRVRVHLPHESSLHERFARVVERAPAEGVWRCIMLDKRDWPSNPYDWAFRYDEIRPAPEGRRPTARVELARFVAWLEAQGVLLACVDPAAFFYYGKPPLMQFVDNAQDSVVERYVREHY